MSELKGCTEPRIYTKPLRKLTPDTTLGYAFIAFSNEVLGLTLLPWQEWLAIHALELTKDGSFRYRVVVIEIARQNGKSTFAKALALFFLYVMQVKLVLGTAQNLDTATDVWEDAVATAQDIADLKSEIAQVTRGNAGKSLNLRGGGKYAVKAATSGGARGKSCDLVLLDELREQTNWKGWAAISGTTTARPDSIIWTMSNAGDEQSVVLRHLRMQAHKALGDPDGIIEQAGELMLDIDDDVDDVSGEAIGLFEWSAPPGCDIHDHDGWCQANPSLGYGFLTERALKTALTYPEAVFRTEHLCQWVEAVVTPPFPATSWEDGQDPDSEIDGDALVYGIDMSEDRNMTAIGVCGRRKDGLWHVELIAYRTGVAWAVDWLAKAGAKRKIRIGLQARGCPIAAYIDDIRNASPNVEVVECEGRDIGAWTGRFYDSVAACAPESDSDAIPVMHRPQPYLDRAASIAQKKNLGDGAYSWDRRSSLRDISPLVAVTMAFGLATIGRTEKRTIYPTAYEERRVMFA